MAGRIAQANGRLKAARVGVRIEQVGDRLVLRGTLPPKPGSSKSEPHQQRLYLGIHANPHGLSEAEKEARKVGALRDSGDFDWAPYLSPASQKPELVRDWLQRMESQYFSTRQRTDKTLTTWKGDYLKVYRRLPEDQPLTAELMRSLILETEPDSKTRKRTCMALGALAELAGIELDSKQFAGKYSPRRVGPRDLPDDQAIAHWREQIANPGWRWVYGMLATYGLRNHEPFRVNLDRLRAGDHILEVMEGKTGDRLVWPCYPEWFDQWELAKVTLPPIDLDRPNEAVGHSVTRYLRSEFRLPFKPYDLRHCWAIRTMEFGLPVELAARQMGHSVEVHTNTYHQWLTENHHQRAYELLMLRSDRPKPPKVLINGILRE